MDLQKVQQLMTQAEQNLILLQSLIPRSEKFYVWSYDRDGSFVATSCPEEERIMLQQAFQILGGTDRLLQYAQHAENTHPQIIGSSIGMQWALSYESERNRSLIFVIGPVFYAAPTERQLRVALSPYTHSRENAAWAAELIHLLPALPVMSYAIFTRYVMMVHNTLTGQQLGLDALNSTKPESEETTATPTENRDRNKVYLAERAMLQMVRNGDINYNNILQNSIRLSPGVPVQGQDPLRQMKTSNLVFITLVSRAAIEGGLSPEVAYAVGDSYIQSTEDCRDSGELSELAHAMYHDFIYRVHHLRTNPNYSHAIQKCCDYIELSLDRKIRTADLAALVGYTEYYLTEKFKKETGQSVSSYIRYAKVERAKVLLETSDLSIKDIADRLAFNTVNYFIQSFRDTTGYTPAQYRKRFQKG
ncbi:MAG: helix-turn-helix domain-containing protein [Oscillospiraceae bacterium]|nr:helix-turn-helix domain-containing protein [Oscillospiraceae bacterium]